MSLSSRALAAALSMAACSAFAASSVDMQLTNLRLVLVDLDPSDGIAPSVSFSNDNSRGSAWVNFSAPSAGGQETAEFNGLGGAWTPGAAAVSGPYSSASVSLSGTGTLAGSSIVGAGAAVAPAGGYCLPSSLNINDCFTTSASFGSSALPMGINATFVLSANTLMTISADASMSLSATSGGWVEDFVATPSARPDRASAWLTMIVIGPGPDGTGQQLSGEYKTLSATARHDALSGNFLPSSEVYANTIDASFRNATSGTLAGTVYIDFLFTGSAAGNALLVPEPGAWALMLGGLAAVAGVARRRRPG